MLDTEDPQQYDELEKEIEQKTDAYDAELRDFFNKEVPVPSIFIGGEALRSEYFEAEEKIIKRSNCNACEINYYKAFFIQKLLSSIK
jgi:hypothetical protein